MATSIKKRNWCFVVWPESAPSNWRDLLQQTGLMFAISPLHDRDINPTGETKKAHYHVIMVFNGPTSEKVAFSVAKQTGANCVQPLEQIRGYYRYFTHKDNPEKFQYSEDDISTINGFDIQSYVELTYAEISKYLLQLQYLIIDHDINEYSDLMDFLAENGLDELWNVAKDKTIYLNTYITSKRHKLKKGLEKK